MISSYHYEFRLIIQKITVQWLSLSKPFAPKGATFHTYLVRDKKSSSFGSKKGKNLGKIGESRFLSMENDSASLHRLTTLLIVELSKYLA